MTFSLSIHLLICMSVFLQSCCRGLRPPCNASEPDSESQRNKEFVCKGINHNYSLSSVFFFFYKNRLKQFNYLYRWFEYKLNKLVLKSRNQTNRR